MDSEALAAVAEALPALLRANVAHARETAEAMVQAAAVHMSSGTMSLTSP